MAQPAEKQETSPANDSQYRATGLADVKPVEATGENDKPAANVAPDNPVKRAIDEFMDLLDEMEDLREVLIAHGIPLRTTRMMVELGVQKSYDNQSEAIDSAMKQAQKSLGEAALKREDVENYVSTLVNLERDYTHARSVARDEGLDTHALSVVTQMIQRNPGDGGSKAANTLLSYIVSSGIEVEQMQDMVADLLKKPTSVLPQVARKADKPVVLAKKKLLQDMLVGLGIGVVVIWALL